MLIPSFVVSDKVKILGSSGATTDAHDGCFYVLPYKDAVAHNLITGHSMAYGLGYSTSITNTLTDLNEFSATTIPIPSSAITVQVVSTSVNDTAAGTGVRTVILYGLDSSFNEISETLTMNGTSAVTSVNQYIRFNFLHAATVGSISGFAAGDITLFNGATVYKKIVAGGNKDQTCHYTVPNNKTCQLVGWSTNAETGKDMRFNLRATANGAAQLLSGIYLFQSVDMNGSGWLPICRYYPAKTDIKISAKMLSPATATGAGQFDMIVEG